jgi:hypothetical protein
MEIVKFCKLSAHVLAILKICSLQKYFLVQCRGAMHTLSWEVRVTKCPLPIPCGGLSCSSVSCTTSRGECITGTSA